MSSSKTLFFLCIAFILGIFFESVVKIPQFLILGILILGVVFVFVSFFTKNINLVVGFCMLFILMGVLRVQIVEFSVANDELSKLNDKDKITITGVIFYEPDVRDTSQKIKVKVGESIVLVTTNRYPEYKYLDEVKLTGKLETPGVIDDFNYKNYLLKDHIHSVMSFPKIELVSKSHKYTVYSFLYEKILFIKEKIRESIQNNFLPPQSSILEGTILGDNGAMTADLKDKLNITGLRHIIAVSGTHVVILGAIIMSLLVAMGFWRGQAFYIAIIFICLYIILTGLPVSGIRAGIMGGIYLLSQKIGRQTMGSRLITLACAIMLLINPFLLLYDVGFQLSFMAVLGLIYLEPYLKIFLKNSIISTTFAAQIFTLPIMIYNFGNISIVSPITNLLVLPIVYGLMVFGFLASIVGIFSSALGWILSVPCWFLLSYFVWVIDFFSKPQMAINITNVSWLWLVALYILIGLLVWFLKKKYSLNFL